MPVTYDAGTNTITVTGYTEATPCTFLDIYNADVAGGWGVVSRQCTNQYCFNAKLQIGDGSTTTWFADKKQQIMFPAGMSGTEDIVVCKNNAHVRLGELLDATAKTGHNGCHFIDLEGVADHEIWWGETGTDVYLYGCSFHCSRINAAVYFVTRIYSCAFVDNIQIDARGAAIDVANCSIANSTYAVYHCTGSQTVSNIRAFSPTRATGFALGSNGIVKDSYVRNATYAAVGSSLSGNPQLINLDTDSWAILWLGSNAGGKIYRKYTFDLKVTDKDENAVNGATVKIFDKDNNCVVDTTTDAGGEITTQTLTYGYYDMTHDQTPVLQTPHTIQISKAGYQTYKKKFTMDEKIDWRIRLLQANPVQFLENEPILQLCPESQEDDSIVFAAL